MSSDGILSIGHSTHPIGLFIDLLAGHGVDVVADVRSTPFSRFNPQFNGDRLPDALAGRGVGYEFFGDELGGRPGDPRCYGGDGRVDYGLVRRTDGFRAGIRRLAGRAAAARVALMCAEREPLHCHRTLLVAEALAEAGHEVRHIYADGAARPHADVVAGLVDGRQGELFAAAGRGGAPAGRARGR